MFWLFEIPLAVALATLTPMRSHAVFVSVLVAYTTLAVVSTLLFRRGTWRNRAV